MEVVSDTSPLNYLVVIGEVSLLPILFGTVLIPRAVQQELMDPDAPETVRQWIGSAPDWLEVRDVEGQATIAPLQLGESEAIALALSANADLILIDERMARAVARERGLTMLGTLGVLARAADEGLVSLPEAVEKLRQTSYRISEDLVEAALERDAQRRQAAHGQG
jgi:predicted nucleic acid-binding protein